MVQELIRNMVRTKIDSGVYKGASFLFGKPFEKKIEIYEGTLGDGSSKKINSETVFDLQSITKAIATAPLTMKLAQKGIIELDQCVGEIFEKYGTKNNSLSKVTFFDLLTHSSGLSDADLDGDFKQPTDLWNHMLNAKNHFPPGSGIEYTDLGYRLLGKALELVLKENLEVAAHDLVWKPAGLKSTSYVVKDILNVAATPDANGVIDDEQVRFLGGVLGCDGAFSTAQDLFNYMSYLLTKDQGLLELFSVTRKDGSSEINSFFDSLAIGSKSAGWELNSGGFSYAGKFRSSNTLEKAGGAGTFIWVDPGSKYIFVYLTNFGKPKPFNESSWNNLIQQIGPHDISNLIYENTKL